MDVRGDWEVPSVYILHFVVIWSGKRLGNFEKQYQYMYLAMMIKKFTVVNTH